ncbi:MAG: hypothetical protein H6670_04130 [Anaerolineaceae bacterium]|nr:hypothetical protein [Anaerolineaceae bacterium]
MSTNECPYSTCVNSSNKHLIAKRSSAIKADSATSWEIPCVTQVCIKASVKFNLYPRGSLTPL